MHGNSTVRGAELGRPTVRRESKRRRHRLLQNPADSTRTGRRPMRHAAFLRRALIMLGLAALAYTAAVVVIMYSWLGGR